MGRVEQTGTRSVLPQNAEAVIALDPGATVGWAYWTTRTSYVVGQVPHTAVWKLLDAYKSKEFRWLLYEGFDYRDWQPDADLTGVKVIGIAEEWRRQRAPRMRIKEQRAHQAKFFFTNDRLKIAGLYKPGEAYTHAMDALRHVLYFRSDYTIGGTIGPPDR